MTFRFFGEPLLEYVEHERTVISLRENSHALRLASELADLRAAKPNPCVLRTPCRSRRVNKNNLNRTIRFRLLMVTHPGNRNPRFARVNPHKGDWRFKCCLRIEGFDLVMTRKKSNRIPCDTLLLFLVTHRRLEPRTP